MKAHIKIMRLATGGRAPEAEGTFGIMKLRGEAGLLLQTAELPDRDNEPFKSRIPAGVYQFERYTSARFGRCIRLKGVPGRSHILMHTGNWAGDVDKDFRTNSWGCILPGMSRGMLAGQMAVKRSRVAMGKLREWLDANPDADTIEIVDQKEADWMDPTP